MSHNQDPKDENMRLDVQEQVTNMTSNIVNKTTEGSAQHNEEEEQTAAKRAQRTSKARAHRLELQGERYANLLAEQEAKRQAQAQAEQEAERQAQAEYESRPLQWKDSAWLTRPQLLEATLALPAEGYRAWLTRHQMYGTVGLQPSAYDNPISEYLSAVMGLQPQLQTDGHRAWFMLQLTKAMRDTDARYLRVVLPAWVTQLALEYTGFPVGRTSGHPQLKEVCAYDAYRLLERVLSDTSSNTEGP